MVKENNCLIEPKMRCGNEIEITLKQGEIFKEEVLDLTLKQGEMFKEEVLDFDINKNSNHLNSDTSINFIIIILVFLILRDMSM